MSRFGSGNTPWLPQPIWATERLTLPYDQDIISFEFAALSYAAPQKSRYRYMLEGLETRWNEVDSTRRFAIYTDLNAGNYVFRVQATNKSGVWSDQEVALNMTVLPPWWETTWFRVSVLVVICGVAFAGYRWRVSAIERQNRLLETQVTERTNALAESNEQLKMAKEKALKAQRAAEAAKRASEVANQAKSTFLANMSHELRSPLTAILGFTHVMISNQTLSPENQENIGIIRRSGEHLLTLINQVLDLSKIEAGRTTLNLNNVDLHRLLHDVQDMFALKADMKGLHLLFEQDAAVPQYVRTDDVKLRQVLINLLNNAVKFTDDGGVAVRVKGGRLKVNGERLKVNGEGQEEKTFDLSPLTFHLQFEIEDTGPGIAPEDIDTVFEAFGQAETGRHAQEGTGLGLPISRKFVQLMGGDMQVKSAVGKGTVFTFAIQGQVVDAADLQSPPRPAASLRWNRGSRAIGC